MTYLSFEADFEHAGDAIGAIPTRTGSLLATEGEVGDLDGELDLVLLHFLYLTANRKVLWLLGCDQGCSELKIKLNLGVSCLMSASTSWGDTWTF